MRLNRIALSAFGPFTDRSLSFPSDETDFHLIFGENEAGKSSLLRAIHDLLFGIPAQSKDNFVHKHAKMLLQGELENAAGDRLYIQRRKGNKNTLLDSNGEALSESALHPYLGAVDAAYFSNMFALGGVELREGAEALLRGSGAVGQALFSASMGGTPVQRILEELTAESDCLYRGRASANTTIRPSVKKYKELLKQSKEAVVSAAEWAVLEKSLTEDQAEKEQLEAALILLQQEGEWLARCEDALPFVGRLRAERAVLADLPDLPEMSSDFVERTKAARTGLAEAQARVTDLNVRVDRFAKQLAELPSGTDGIEAAGDIEALHQALGAYRAHKKQLVDLNGKCAIGKERLTAEMKSLDFAGNVDAIDDLRVSRVTMVGCQEDAIAWQHAGDALEAHHAQTLGLKRKVGAAVKVLSELQAVDQTALKSALLRVVSLTDQRNEIITLETNVLKQASEAQRLHGLLRGAPSDLDATAALSVPSKSTVRRFRDLLEAQERAVSRLEEQLQEGQSDLADLQTALDQLHAQEGALPSLDALKDARAHRDAGWERVVSEWKDGEESDSWSGTSRLEDAYPKAVHQADEVADLLREEAEAVAEAEQKQRAVDRQKKQLESVAKRLRADQKKLAVLHADWESEWADCGISPRSPVEMEEWQEQWLAFGEALQRWQLTQGEEEAMRKRNAEAEKQLAIAMGADSDALGGARLIEVAEVRVHEGDEANGRIKFLNEQLEEMQSQLSFLEQEGALLVDAEKAAAAAWSARRKDAGLPQSLSPSGALKLLEDRQNLVEEFDVWRELAAEGSRVEAMVSGYEADLAAAAEAAEIEADTVEGKAAALWRTFTASREAAVKREELTRQNDEVSEELALAQSAQERAKDSLALLIAKVGLKTVDELEPLLVQVEKRTAITQRLTGLESDLAGLARGESVAEFVASVQAEDEATLSSRKAAVLAEQAEKRALLVPVLDRLANWRKQKKDLEAAGDDAAHYRQEAESVAAAIKADAARFVRLRLAAQLLEQQIEQFREENQGPLLRLAGEAFREMTQGAFSGLEAEYNAQDVPVLVGRRADDSLVPVEGMSEGSRDQLFLALRLAALDHYLGEHEPMPLILDDLLITFDDPRTEAILQQLGEMSRRTQVLVFTHHEHVVELCQKTVSGAKVWSLAD